MGRSGVGGSFGEFPRSFQFVSSQRAAARRQRPPNTYDQNGNLLTRTLGGITATYTYDSLDELLTKTYSDGTPTATYSYNYSWLTQVTVTGGTTEQNTAFDGLGRVTGSTQSTGGVTFPFTYAYNLADGVTQMQLPSERVVTTSYDGAGRSISVSGEVGGATTPYVTGATYALQGALATLPFYNGITETTTYNARLQPTTIQAGGLLTLSYSYGTTNDNGNVQSQTITRPSGTWTQSYAYTDGVNRLTSASETGPGTAWTESYGYDSSGNRWVTGYPGLPAPTNETPQGPGWYGTNNRIVTAGWTYDGAGNVTAVGGTSRSFAYDAENRQKTATVNGTATTYAYDGDGRRVSKTMGTQTTLYAYDAFGNLAQEYGVTGATAGTQYYTADHLGSTRLVTDATGSAGTMQCFDYMPFGAEIASGTDGRASCFGNGTDAFYPEFTAKERDSESGLDFFGARYFSGAQGRFTSPDEPLNDQYQSDPQSWNLYSYVRNNPLKFTDPTGQDCIYTNNLSSNGTVGIERGDCSQNGGTYVNGTIDTNSLAYNQQKSTLSYSYTNGDTLGSGVIGGLPAPVQFPGIEGPANQAGAAQIAGSQSLINEFAKQAAIGAAGGVAGRLIGAGVEALLAARAAGAAAAAVDVANLSNKIVRQMASRGWTAQEITETVQNGKAYSVLNKATGGAATEYINPANGKFVVVDNATKQVLQVSGPGFSPNHLVP